MMTIEKILQKKLILFQLKLFDLYFLLLLFNLPKEQLEQVINFLKEQFIISSLNVNTLDQTLMLCKKYNFSFWDGMMIAAALDNHCSIIYTEDLNHNQLIENRLKIINPFIQTNIKI